ncbi:MAG: formylmethanofuran dehydrogenase subunit [Chloroflexota bacterium]|nr:formylmethanofuran dehydrogenase subunit [Chloroflexota bacterium]
MSTPPERLPDVAPGQAPPTVVTDATCTACGCLCDDIGLAVEGGRIVAADRACELGGRWFLADHDQRALPVATVAGRAAGTDEALDHAAAILREARSPVVLGLTRTSNETVAEALALADRLGAVVDVGPAMASARNLRAIQRVGRVSATLGEVKNRADVVVFWGVDPVVTHPRHWERYSVEPRGRFVPGGRAGRSVIVADTERTATAARADAFVAIAEERQFETLWTVRALARGIALDPRRVERLTGTSLEVLLGFAGRLLVARYGAWFYGPSLGWGRGGSACIEAALTLVRDLNARTRFVILPLGESGNAAGAEAVLTWQTGSPQSVDFSGDFPRALPDRSSAAAMLERGEADVALIVADEVEPWLPDAALRHLEQIPRIVIAPRATAIHPTAHVALAAATPGIDAAGTVMRVDGVVLPLRPPLVSPVPSEREWLRALDERLKTQESRS